MKYKVGDKIRIKPLEQLKHDHRIDNGNIYKHQYINIRDSNNAITPDMFKYCGTIQEIGIVNTRYGYYWLNNITEGTWQDWMFDETF